MTARVAVLGAGHVGPIIARVAAEAGYRVAIAHSGDPAEIALATSILSPGAEARWAADAIADADLVVLAIPLHRFAGLSPALVEGHLVVDTMNYWPPIDGTQPRFDDPRYGSSEIVQRRLAGASVVKTLNHIGYHEIEADRRDPDSAERRALGVAGDDPRTVAEVAEFVERIGYDAVELTPLRAGRLLQPGGPVFGAALRRAEFERALAQALDRDELAS